MKSILLVILMMAVLVSAEEHSAVVVTPIKSADGRDAFRLCDGKTEAIVVPALGRVMAYKQVNGTNWLWNAPPEKVEFNGWKNYGGEKAWVAPQSAWPLFIGHEFPPDPAWESGHEAEVLTNPPRLKTTSPTSACGVRIVREFTFNARGEFVTSTTLEKMDDRPLQAGAWTITQVTPPDAVFLPTSDASAYKNNYYAFSRKPGSNIASVSPTLIRVVPSIKGSYKIGVDAPIEAIAAVRDGVAFIQRADRVKGNYPDGADEAGFPVELFDLGQADLHYIELELLSPVAPLMKGQHRTFVVYWKLLVLPSQDIDSAEMRQALEKAFRP